MPNITSSFHPRAARASFPHQTPDLPDAGRLFDDWNRALQAGDADLITQLYCTHAVLLPTADDDVRVGHAHIRDYFVHFMANRPQGRILERHTQTGWDMLVDMGSYAFRLADGRDITARYTFVYRPSPGAGASPTTTRRPCPSSIAASERPQSQTGLTTC